MENLKAEAYQGKLGGSTWHKQGSLLTGYRVRERKLR